MFDLAVDGPLEYVKESLKVSPCAFTNPSIRELMVVARLMAATLPWLRRVLIESPTFRTKGSTKATSGW